MNYIILTVSSTLLFTIQMPPALGLVFFALAAFAVLRIHDSYLKNKKRKQDGKRIENMYFVELPPSGGIDLPFGKDRYGAPMVYYCKSGTLGLTMKSRLQDIEDSGNDRDVRGRMYFFQDAEEINETEQEYAERVIKEIKEDRACKHGTISKDDRKFYVDQQLMDNQFEWEQEN